MKNLTIKFLVLSTTLLIGFAPAACAKAEGKTEEAKKTVSIVQNLKEYRGLKKELGEATKKQNGKKEVVKALEGIKKDEEALKNEKDEKKKEALQKKIEKAKQDFAKKHKNYDPATLDQLQKELADDDKAIKNLEAKLPGLLTTAGFTVAGIWGVRHVLGAIENNPKKAFVVAALAGLGIGYLIANTEEEEGFEADWR